MSPEGPGEPDKDIEDILSGLGDVLKDITGEAPPPTQAPRPAERRAERPAAKPPPEEPPEPDVPVEAPPAKKPAPARTAPPPRPAAAPETPGSDFGPPPGSEDIPPASGIELAPRAGILGGPKKPPEKKPPEKKAPEIPRSEGMELKFEGAPPAARPPARPPAAAKKPPPPPPPAAPIEIVLPGAGETPAAPEPARQPEPESEAFSIPDPEPEPPPPPRKAEPAPPPPEAKRPPPPPPPKPIKAAPAPAPEPAAPGEPGGIPAGTPREQVRRVAFLHSAEQAQACVRFAEFLGTVALKVSKRPLYIDRALFLEVGPSMSSNSVLERVRSSGAVAAIGLLRGLRSAQTKDIEEVFEKAEFFFRAIAAEDVEKRPLAIDLVVDIMLLKPES